MPAVSKFTNDSGARFTKSIFYEMVMADKSTCVYTLKNEDHKGFPSLYRLYMEEEDPKEYRFANKYLQDWEHWQMLCELSWFKPLVTRWREELQLKLESEALYHIISESRAGRKESFAANKYLLEKGWGIKPKDSVGRPSKEHIKREAERMFTDNSRVLEDLNRLGVNSDVGS